MKNLNIGERIRLSRLRRGMTQQELAKLVGISWEMISRYERNQSSPMKRIDQIAQALAIPSSKLILDSSPSLHDEESQLTLPYFTKIPERMAFSPENTHEFYISPLWITSQYSSAFVLDATLFDSKTVLIRNDGPIYISNEKAVGDEPILIANSLGELYVVSKEMMSKRDRIIGRVIAQEKRFA